MSKRPARKRFGQHFLTDPGVVDDILRSVCVTRDDVVVEIGPGRGAITEALARQAGHLHAVELDRDLVRDLRRQYEGFDNVTVHEADALAFDYSTLGNRLRIVGNLPYNISTPLLFHLLKYRDHVIDLHFMLQKEVVARMAASPGGKAYGRLGIMLGCHFRIESLFEVDRSAFDPPPDVQSAVVRLDPLPADHFRIDDEELLAKIVSMAFMKRRKTIRNGLKELVSEDDFAAVDIDPQLRPEQIEIERFILLSNHMASVLG